jgi:hypothetical protein
MTPERREIQRKSGRFGEDLSRMNGIVEKTGKGWPILEND